MNPRELLILILGLAVVAVVLRGLFLALRARRSQIRLAIDKNIPRDVDLDALELAELPGGGARVVARSFDEVNRQNNVVAMANARAEAIDLGKSAPAPESIPMLMDPVEVRTLAPRQAAPVQEVPAELENPDDVLFDYDDDYEETGDERSPHSLRSEEDGAGESTGSHARAQDLLAQVTPDYGDDDDNQDDDFDDDLDDEDDFDDDAFDEAFDEEEGDIEEDDSNEGRRGKLVKKPRDDSDEDDFEDEAGPGGDDNDFDDDDDDDDDDDFEDDDYDSALDDIEDDDDADYEDDYDDDTDEDDLDNFSMTAGERIGFGAAQAATPARTVEREKPEAQAPKRKRRPLFAALTHKLRARQAELPDVAGEATEVPSAPTVPAAPPAPAPTAQETTAPQRTRPESPAPVDGEVAPRPAPVISEPSEVVVLNVMAKSGRVFAGDDLLHVLITSGLKFGDMNIFHRRLGGGSQAPVVFSVANILNPGVFDLNRMDEFTTLGVSLFLALPTPINNLEAFTQMLEVAQQICDALDGELRDDNRNLMTAQTKEHYRQRVRDFELRRLKAVSARG